MIIATVIMVIDTLNLKFKKLSNTEEKNYEFKREQSF